MKKLMPLVGVFAIAAGFSAVLGNWVYERVVSPALAQNIACSKPQGGASWLAGTGCTFDGNGVADVFVLDADADTSISSPTDDQIDIEIAGADDFRFTANTFDVLSGSTLEVTGILSIGAATVSATGTELDEYTLSTCITDISTAQSDWVVAPHAGDIARIYSVIDGALITANAALTFEIAGVAVTNGAITVAFSGSAAGDVDSSTPTAANTVTAGQAIEVITDGASANTVEVCISMLIAR